MRHLITLAVLLIAVTVMAGEWAVERARRIPLVYDVDVVVIGGSTRAVAAAVAAKEAGSDVFLMAARPYLGADMCATYRLGLKRGEQADTPLAERIFAQEPPTLMHVKRTLDEALLKTEVDFLYGCYPTGTLQDEDGTLAGVVMVNRSGRQAVRAKVIVDATDRAVVARLAGATFLPYPAGTSSFERRVLGGKPGPGAKKLPLSVEVKSDSRRKTGTKRYDLFAYALELPMKDDSWRSFAEAESIARNRTWQEGQADASDALFQVPPDPVVSRRAQKGAWPGANRIDLKALQPADLDGLFVLGGCADLSREAAKALLRPVNGMAVGLRVGELAARNAQMRLIGGVESLTVRAKPGGRGVGTIGERLYGLRGRPGLERPRSVKSPERALPVLGHYDVVVVGGGTAGAPAGIAASRTGVDTLVIECLGGLGGVGTMGRISRYYHGNKVGFTQEVDAGAGGSGWNIEKKMEWFRKEIETAGGTIWFRTLACGSVVKDERFVGVVVATPLGRGVILANSVIDSTGNAVLPACAGIPCQEINDEHISVQGAGLPTFSPGVGYLNGDWTFINDDDVVDVWRSFVVAKQKYKKRFSSFDLGQLPTTRARRRIIGDVVITPMDIINKRMFPDVITVAKSNFDNHGFSSHTLFMITAPNRGGLVGNIPYRALMPKGYDGLLVTGLGLSAHGDAMPVLRMQPDVQNQGYAAGYAAALAAKERTTVRGIDVKSLQKHLVDKAIIPEKMLNAQDSYPFSDEALQQAVDAFGHSDEKVSVILTAPERALPLLQSAWREATNPEAELRYAHVLGMLGDNTGVESLVEELSDAAWDEGWDFRGMGQYGPTTSYVDNLVIALGRTRDQRATPVILRMLNTLSPRSHFSHQRAAAIACETLRDPEAAKPLHDLLIQEGMTGHAFTTVGKAIDQTPSNPGDVSTRRRSLPELVLARALYRCGDYEGMGERILNEYARDLRGHYATHAAAVLSTSAGEGP